MGRRGGGRGDARVGGGPYRLANRCPRNLCAAVPDGRAMVGNRSGSRGDRRLLAGRTCGLGMVDHTVRRLIVRGIRLRLSLPQDGPGGRSAPVARVRLTGPAHGRRRWAARAVCVGRLAAVALPALFAAAYGSAAGLLVVSVVGYPVAAAAALVIVALVVGLLHPGGRISKYHGGSDCGPARCRESSNTRCAASVVKVPPPSDRSPPLGGPHPFRSSLRPVDRRATQAIGRRHPSYARWTTIPWVACSRL
jgi:hypothetical protein